MRTWHGVYQSFRKHDIRPLNHVTVTALQKALEEDAASLVGSFLLTMEHFYLQLASLALLLTIGAFLLATLALPLTIGAFLLTVGKCV